MDSLIKVKPVDETWEIVSGHMRFTAMTNIGKAFDVFDVDGQVKRRVQIIDGEPKIASNVIVIK